MDERIEGRSEDGVNAPVRSSRRLRRRLLYDVGCGQGELLLQQRLVGVLDRNDAVVGLRGDVYDLPASKRRSPIPNERRPG